jgi:outer membrane protein OmpA-like peptidoglycan-associated protein
MRVLFLLLATVVCFFTHAQNRGEILPEGYYVIVGAFSKKENAVKYNASLIRQGLSSSFGYVESRGLFYVFTKKDQEHSVCVKEVTQLRQQSQFAEAWVRYIGATSPETDTIAAPVITTSLSVTSTTALLTSAEEDDEVIEPNPEIVQPDKVTLGNTEVFLSLYNSRNDRVAEGKVQVIDTDRGRMITEVPGNTYLILPDPKSTSQNLTLICDVVGYRKIQKEINYANPTQDSSFITEMGTSLVANFELVQYQKGDIRTLYNIYFFNDAAVMMPESKFELNSLLQMMNNNPTYQIRLHGHANGNYSGKIIKRGASGDFFSVASDAKTTIGTAKELSESRAQVIADYLIENGVDRSRVDVKAWGGKRPLFDKKGPNAKKNIRVEVEVIGE